jgi:hypothetical protein
MQPQEEPTDDEVDLDDFADAAALAANPIRRLKRKQSKQRCKQVSGGRIALLASAIIPAFGVLVFSGIWLLSRSDTAMLMVLGNLCVAAVYLALYIWARRNPVKGLQAGHRLVFLLLAIEIGLVVSDPGVAFVSSLAMRLYTLYLLSKGLKAAKARQAMKDRAASTA